MFANGSVNEGAGSRSARRGTVAKIRELRSACSTMRKASFRDRTEGNFTDLQPVGGQAHSKPDVKGGAINCERRLWIDTFPVRQLPKSPALDRQCVSS
jgi:hypothetical protein